MKKSRLLPCLTLLATLLLGSCDDGEAGFQPSALDRRMVVESLQTLSDYVGFEATFSLGASDTTLLMRGSDLCGEDFPQLIAPAWWRDVVAAGFETFECESAHGSARIAVRP